MKDNKKVKEMKAEKKIKSFVMKCKKRREVRRRRLISSV